MNSLFERTGLHHDNVMVFPYGIFSPEAGLALKENGFFAAVNTDVTPADLASNETTIADLWSVAILRYGGFPIFTRRYIDHELRISHLMDYWVSHAFWSGITTFSGTRAAS